MYGQRIVFTGQVVKPKHRETKRANLSVELVRSHRRSMHVTRERTCAGELLSAHGRALLVEERKIEAKGKKEEKERTQKSWRRELTF